VNETTDRRRVDQTFAALADPTRRAVLRTLALGPQRAGELAAGLAMTPAALSRHLRVLRHCGLITDDEPEHDARVRLYRLQPIALAPLHDWLQELEGFWGDQLAAFKQHAERGLAPTQAAASRRARGG
jgi:DNA-binding transcriptional ArsR family regulator